MATIKAQAKKNVGRMIKERTIAAKRGQNWQRTFSRSNRAGAIATDKAENKMARPLMKRTGASAKVSQKVHTRDVNEDKRAKSGFQKRPLAPSPGALKKPK